MTYLNIPLYPQST